MTKEKDDAIGKEIDDAMGEWAFNHYLATVDSLLGQIEGNPLVQVHRIPVGQRIGTKYLVLAAASAIHEVKALRNEVILCCQWARAHLPHISKRVLAFPQWFEDVDFVNYTTNKAYTVRSVTETAWTNVHLCLDTIIQGGDARKKEEARKQLAELKDLKLTTLRVRLQSGESHHLFLHGGKEMRRVSLNHVTFLIGSDSTHLPELQTKRMRKARADALQREPVFTFAGGQYALGSGGAMVKVPPMAFYQVKPSGRDRAARDGSLTEPSAGGKEHSDPV